MDVVYTAVCLERAQFDPRSQPAADIGVCLVLKSVTLS